ncbi:hypothetical protein ACFV3R_25600 [Streptomyces sp. NPDC059740]|uniref:hypothetical protein n=1 Tax=Streptomyces sp. NPDC059740 TaxID=3346926 RepID=UPI00365EDECA
MGHSTNQQLERNIRLLRGALYAPKGQRLNGMPHTQTVEAPAPADLDLLDYLATVERDLSLADYTPAPAEPPTGGAPALDDYLAAVAVDHGLDLERERTIRTNAHLLAQTILLGDRHAVCKRQCPQCRCWSLMWDRAAEMDEAGARCTNADCRDEDGRPSRWSLYQLAEDEHLERERRQAHAN